MLIEDLTILTETENIFENPVIVKAINISYGINELSSATISIEISEDGAIHYHEFPTYDLQSIVGKPITIRWKNKPLEIFSGLITGIQLDKSEANVSYSIVCSGGPLALYNTTLSIKGWYPQGAYDAALPHILFRNAIFEKWSSPKTFLEALSKELIAFDSKEFNPETKNSQGTKNAAATLKKDIDADINKLLEPKLLKRFWGFVGEFQGNNDTFKFAIERRMLDLIQSEGATYTYWQILLTLCNEIGLHVVPWINRTFILPDALFSNAPKANVIFPSLIRDITVSTDPFTFPDQIIIPTDIYLTTGVEITLNQLTETNSIAVPSDVTNENARKQNSPYQGNRYRVVVSPKYARYVLLYPDQDTIDKFKKTQKEDITQLIKRQNNKEDISKSTDLYESFAKNMGNYFFQKMRSERNTAQVICAFQPYLIPGFTAYIIDGKKGGMNFRGTISRIEHSITELDAQTTINLSNTVFPVTEQFVIDSPLWRELLPNQTNVKGAQIVTELVEKIPGFPINASEQVPVDEDILENEAMDNALEAARYTGRIT